MSRTEQSPTPAIMALTAHPDASLLTGAGMFGHLGALDIAERRRAAKLSARQRFLTPPQQGALHALLGKVQADRALLEDLLGVKFDDWSERMMSQMLTHVLGEVGTDPLAIAQRHALYHNFFAQTRSHEWGNPLWVLDDDVAQALHKTEPPFDVFTETLLETLLRLPFPGLYLQLPKGLYDIHDPDTGPHAVEGIYLASSMELDADAVDEINVAIDAGDIEDGAYAYGNAIEAGRQRMVLTLAAVGEANGLIAGEVNDTVMTAQVWAGVRSTSPFPWTGMDDTMRVAINFLMALNADYLQAEEKAPRGGKRNTAKRRRAERQGTIMETYTRVSLSTRGKRAAGRSPGGATGTGRALDHAVPVAGHWSHYWVTQETLGDRPFHATRVNAQGTKLYSTVRWIYPYVRGPGDRPAGPRYKVTS